MAKKISALTELPDASDLGDGYIEISKGGASYKRQHGYKITTAETAAGVTVVNYAIPSHDVCGFVIVDRYGTNTTPGTTNMTTAVTAAKSVASQIGRGKVLFFATTYVITAGTNLAAAGIGYYSTGITTLDYSAGTGIGLKLDAGGSSALIQRMHMEGFLVKGGPSITDAFYSRGIVRSTFRNIEAREATTNGYSLLFSVLNTYDHCVISNDLGTMTTIPTNYWKLDNDGVVGNHTQANVFLNCEASGVGSGSTKTGWLLNDAILNTWINGTAESLGTGVDIASDTSSNNAWVNFDLEDNQTYDVKIKGHSNAFYNSFAQSPSVTDNILISTGIGTVFNGGYYREVNLGASSSDTLFQGVTFDSNASRGIQGTGTYKTYGCWTNADGGGVNGAKVASIPDIQGWYDTAVAFVFTQGVTPTGTTTLNEATVNGNKVALRGKRAFTSAGTGASAVLIDFPSKYAARTSQVGLPCGSFLFTTSGGTRYTGTCYLNTSTELALVCNAATSIFGTNPAVTIANGDTLTFDVEFTLPAVV